MMKMIFRNNKVKIEERLFCYLMTIFLFGYLGVFSRYRIVPSYCLFVLLVVYILIFDSSKFRVSSASKRWILFTGYIMLSMLVFNISTGYWYVVMMMNALLLLSIHFTTPMLLFLLRCIKNGSLIFAVFTFLNYLFPNIIVDLFGFMMSEGNIRTYNNCTYVFKELPGLAGENSFNGFCLGIGLLVVISSSFAKKKIEIKDILYFLALYIAVYLTGRRSWLLLIPLLIAITYFLLLIMDKNSKRKILILMGTLMVGLFAMYLVVPVVWDVLTEGTGSLQLTNREWFWNMAFELFYKHPIVGSGINTYDFLYNERKISQGYIAFAGAHNSYIQFLGEIGICGLTIVLFAIVRNVIETCKNMHRYRNHHNSFEKELILFSFIGQLMVIVYALTENPFYQPQQQMMYFLFVGISIYYQKEMRNLEDEENMG